MYQNKRVYFSCIWSSEAVRLPVTIAMLIDFALGSKLRQAIQLPAPIPLQLAGLARFADKYEQGRAWRSDSIPAALGLKPVALTAMIIRDSDTGQEEIHHSSFHLQSRSIPAKYGTVILATVILRKTRDEGQIEAQYLTTQQQGNSNPCLTVLHSTLTYLGARGFPVLLD